MKDPLHSTGIETASGAVPAARTEDLVMTEAGNEVLVYDQARQHIHHLNQTTAVVWRLCDGRRRITELARDTGAELDGTVDAGVIRLALAKLAQANLLSQPLAASFQAPGHSRRTFLRHAAAGGAIAVPAIVSMTAPSSANGGSELCGASCNALNSQCRGCCSQCGTGPGTGNGTVCLNPGTGNTNC